MTPRHSSDRAFPARTPRPTRRALGAILTAGLLAGSSWGWGTLGTATALTPHTATSAQGENSSDPNRYFGGQLPGFPGDPSANGTNSTNGSATGAPSQWVNPNARSTDPNFHTELTITELPKISGDKATFRLRLTNSRDTTITNPSLSLSWREAPQIDSLRVAQLANLGEYPHQSPTVSMQGSLEPGQSREVTVEVLGTDAPTDSPTNTSSGNTVFLSAPGLTKPGAHPVIFNAGGTLSGDDAPGGHVGSIAVARTAVSVASKKNEAPTPVTLLWPLAAPTFVVPGGTGDAPTPKPLYLRNENLAKDLGEGGRLRGLLDAYRETTQGTDGRELRAATCLAIDPELIETVERMSHGYRVGQKVPQPVKEQRRLRDSWGELLGGDDDNSTEGTGAEAAKTWLNDLREVVKGSCSVALPYAGADINAVANAGDDWLGVQAFGMGAQTIKRILGVVPQQNLVIPNSGYVSPQAVNMLAAGVTQGIDADSSTRYEAMQTGLPTLPAQGDVTALVADNTVNQSTSARPVEQRNNAEQGNAEEDGAAQAEQIAAIDNSWNQRITRLQSPESPQGESNKPSRHQYKTVTFSGNLGTLLQATGANPEVAPYSNPQSRYPMDRDSSVARLGTALAGLDLEIAERNPVLAVPPANWGINKTEARAVLDNLSRHLADDSASAAPLTHIASPRGDLRDTDLATGNTTIPYGDPGASSPALTSFVGNIAGQLHDITLFMRNDSRIALQREMFTRPLFSDLVRSLSGYSMRVRSQWKPQREGRVAKATTVADTAGQLHHSVTLVPPGNVFTRTSDSSPLIVVARNGLPLPVRAKLEYTTGKSSGITIDVPEAQNIPARGSITMPLTTEMPANQGAEQMELWLATTEGKRISAPVKIGVKSAPGLRVPALIFAAMAIIGIAVAGRVTWVRRNRRKGKNRLIGMSSRPVNR